MLCGRCTGKDMLRSDFLHSYVALSGIVLGRSLPRRYAPRNPLSGMTALRAHPVLNFEDCTGGGRCIVLASLS